MPIICLIAPDRLDPDLLDRVRTAFGGSGADWLDPDRAAEFTAPSVPADISDIGDMVRRAGADMAVLPEGDRRKTILLADMDSTMIGQECIDELAEVAGVGPEVAAVTRAAMNGEIDFEPALRERVAHLRGLSTDVIDQVWRDRIALAPGGRTLVATMRAHGAYAALVSGGFTQFTSRVSDALGFDAHRANTLIESGGVLTGGLADPILGRDAKVAALTEIAALRATDPSAVLAVGDGANDLGMIEIAGLGVALHAKPSVAAAAPVRIDHSDLTALLFLQGYRSDEFVT